MDTPTQPAPVIPRPRIPNMTEILIGIILILGSFIGGIAVQGSHDQKMPPKIENTTIIQNNANKNTSIQSSEQAQITTTLITDKTNYRYALSYNGRTNFQKIFESKTNITHKTNDVSDSSLLPKIKLFK